MNCMNRVHARLRVRRTQRALLLLPAVLGLGVACSTPVAEAQGYTYNQTITDGFSTLSNLAFDSSGNLYIADQGNNRIVERTIGGAFSSIGTGGSGPGQLNNPKGIAFNSSGDLFIADGANARVVVHKADDSFTSFGGSGNGNGQFQNTWGIGVNRSSGNIYVVDRTHFRVEEFGPDYSFIRSFGTQGTGPGQFAGTMNGLAVNSSGNVFVTNAANNSAPILEFSGDGTYLATIGGSGPGATPGPIALTFDSHDDLFATSSGRVVKEFDSSNNYVTSIGSGGTGDGQFNNPSGVAVNSSGNVFVSDNYIAENLFRVEEFSPNAAAPIDTPEPGTCAMLAGLGVSGTLLARRRRCKQSAK